MTKTAGRPSVLRPTVAHAGQLLAAKGFSVDHEHVSEGSSGITFRATTSKGDPVAVKVVAVGSREDLAYGHLPSLPGVRPITARVILTSRWVALVSRYYDAGSLRDHVSQHGPYTLSEALAVVDVIIHTLRSLHSTAQIVHGDIKPTNILLDQQAPVIIDFGSSATIGALVADRGTVGYSAPQRTEKASPSDDIYSVGALLFYLATGSDPAPEKIAELLRIIERTGASATTPEIAAFKLILEQTARSSPLERAPLAELEHYLREVTSSFSSRPPIDMASARLEYERTAVVLPAGASILIGRASTDLAVGVGDPQISRRALEFSATESSLLLHVRSKTNIAHVWTPDNRMQVRLLPGETTRLDAPLSVITLSGGPASAYSIWVYAGRELLPHRATVHDAASLTAPPVTVRQFTTSQRRVLAAYCKPILEGLSDESSSHSEVAKILDLSVYTVRNTMQRMVREVAASEIADWNVHPASSRDEVCRLLVRQGIVTVKDLDLLAERR